MLHIVNGESTASTLRESSVTGEVFSFRDALIDGPTPAGLSDQEWRRTRSAHLSESYGVGLNSCEQDLSSQDAALHSFLQHEEVVLWFEHDLFCHVNLFYLLNWFAQQDLSQTKLSLINIGEFPGRENFRGLGELNVEQLGSLFPERHQVTTDELNLATSAWVAYCASEPNAIETLIQSDTSALPFLKRAFQSHLKRFPATRNGLGRIENRSLELVAAGAERFSDLFPEFVRAEPVYGLGDAQLWLALRRVSIAQQPLLEVHNGIGAEQLTADVVHKARFRLTETGQAVLRDEADFIRLNGIDHWLGGVHLHGSGAVWRWDEPAGKIELS